MRIVWKDSSSKLRKTMRYRRYEIYAKSGGWATNVPGDHNIYRTHYCAMNAIDKILGGSGQRGSAKRRAYGIQTVKTL